MWYAYQRSQDSCHGSRTDAIHRQDGLWGFRSVIQRYAFRTTLWDRAGERRIASGVVDTRGIATQHFGKSYTGSHLLQIS